MKEKTEEYLQEFLKGDKSFDDVISELTPNKIFTETKIKEDLPIIKDTRKNVQPIVEKKVGPVIETKVVEKVVVREEIVPNKTLMELLQLVKDLKINIDIMRETSNSIENDMEMLKECMVETLNQTLTGNKIFKERLKNSLEKKIKKKIDFIKDTDGRIVSAIMEELETPKESNFEKTKTEGLG